MTVTLMRIGILTDEVQLSSQIIKTEHMLTPEMIMENVHYGQELEAKGELFLAYWVYWYADLSERPQHT